MWDHGKCKVVLCGEEIETMGGVLRYEAVKRSSTTQLRLGVPRRTR